MHTYVVVPSRFNQTASINWVIFMFDTQITGVQRPNRVTAVPQANSASTVLKYPDMPKRMLAGAHKLLCSLSPRPHPLRPMFFSFSLSAVTQGAYFRVILQVFKQRFWVHAILPNWVQDSERWQERWKKNYWHIFATLFHLCPGAWQHYLCPECLSQSLMKAATSATLLTSKDVFVIPASPPPPP